ncbi:transposon Ty3-G gap-Pol polyprotein [Penaeus vannamei]|uniref:RNA-directed DNA polymerase n=1 Tax=Penaeus vannamei TaxID=6689 RepID=A0A3R7MZ13_PENVA|nr:transposon Ty3-G gap-Pol polyprotein [Penaeus vannamei]
MSSTHRTLPICSLASLPEWFLQVEQEFLHRNITAQTTKFRMLVTNLPPELLLTVGDLLNDQRYATYDELKEAILRRGAPNPLTALSSFLSSDTTDNRTPSEILHHFQRLLTRTGMTFPPDVMRSLFLKRLPADIQQILLVSDAPLEQLALKVDSIIAAKTRAPTVATVSATTATLAATLESLTAQVAALSEAVQRSTRELSHYRHRFRTPSPPRRERNFRRPSPSRHQSRKRLPRKLSAPVFREPRRRLLYVRDASSSLCFLIDTGAEVSLLLASHKDKRLTSSRTLETANATPINVYGERSETLSLTGAPSQRFQWIFLVADVPQPIIGADFLDHCGLSVDLQGKALIHQSGARTLAAPTAPLIYTVFARSCTYKNILREFPALSEPINRATQPWHEVRHHIVTHGPPAHSRCRPLAPDRCRSAKAEFDHMIQPMGGPSAFGEEEGRYPLPHLHSFSHELSGSTVISRIDFDALRSPQRRSFINDVTRGLVGVFAYIDDILVASASEADHTRHLRALFGRLQEAGVVINPGKCLFGAASLSFLGHTVTSQGITPAQEKVTAIRKFLKSVTKKKIRKFLGMFNFYRRFVPKCVQLLKPLHTLITPNRASRNTKIKWMPPTNEAFEACKEALASATLLNHPLPEAPLNIAADASDSAIGSVLQQRQDPVATSVTYSAFGRELLEVRHFQPYVEAKAKAKEFHILTDHKPLTFALHSRTRRQSPCEECHLDCLTAADALSRVTIAAVTHADDAVDYHLVSSEQRQDASMTPLIPPSLRRRFFDAYHQHRGIRATQHLIRGKVVWPGINKDVRQWCRSRKVPTHPHRYSGTPALGRWLQLHPDDDRPLHQMARGYAHPRHHRSDGRQDLPPFRHAGYRHYDRGVQFESELWRQLMVLLGSKRIRTTAYHPCANGMVERLHRHMKQALTSSSSNRRWVEQLPHVLLNIRTSFKEDLQCTAAEMVYGTMLALPADFIVTAGNFEPGTFGKLCKQMTRVRSRPTRPTRQMNIYMPPGLRDCSRLREKISQSTSLSSVPGSIPGHPKRRQDDHHPPPKGRRHRDRRPRQTRTPTPAHQNRQRPFRDRETRGGVL